MDKLSDFINDALNKKGLSAASQGALVCFWADEWGKGAFRPISYSRGVLKLAVDSAAAAQEVSMQSSRLLSYLNSKAGRELVQSVRIENHQ